MDILTVLAFIGSVLMIVIVGSSIAIIMDGDDYDMDEADRRSKGLLVSDAEAERKLLEAAKKCRERMGRDCCLHHEYQFNENHRQVVGRE